MEHRWYVTVPILAIATLMHKRLLLFAITLPQDDMCKMLLLCCSLDVKHAHMCNVQRALACCFVTLETPSMPICGLSKCAAESAAAADLTACIQRRTEELEQSRYDIQREATTLTQDLESTQDELQAAQSSAAQLSTVQKELENVAGDRDTHRSAREAAEEEARELRQAVQKKEDEMRGIKREAKSAHASLDTIGQEANRLSSACQQAADKNKGETRLTTVNSQLGAIGCSVYLSFVCIVICGVL